MLVRGECSPELDEFRRNQIRWGFSRDWEQRFLLFAHSIDFSGNVLSPARLS
jgi:hypothetical protein